MKNIWKGINNIIKIKNTNKSKPISISIDNEICHDGKKVANGFNQYFSNVACNLQKGIHNAGKGFDKYLKNPNDKSFFIRPTNKFEIIEIISSLQQDKSMGPNSIPDSVLKLIKYEIADPLTEIINLSFETGIYFDKLKSAKTIPIYKDKGNEFDCSNYRPTSLLSNINKIVERLMHKRLYSFLDKYECIYQNQFGFRRKHSTIHALVSMTEDIRNALDNDLNVCGIFLDLQKAFDTVDHHILTKKLEHYGVRGIANNWFKSYLSNRRQAVSVNGVLSEEATMHYGVPQGSILGPLLFLIYINDLHTAITHSTVRHFADDTNLIIKNNSAKDLTRDLNKDLKMLNRWLQANKISLNAKKTELIIFRSKWKTIKYDIKVKLDGKKLQPTSFIKYLGLYIDCHLDWAVHAEVITSKLSRTVGMLSKIRHYVDNTVLRSIYFAIFSSVLNYGSIIWGQRSTSTIKRIESVQNKAIRIINFAPFNSKTDEF